MRTQNDSEGESETSRPLGPELPAPSPCQEIIESGTGEIVRDANSIVMLMCLFSPAVPRPEGPLRGHYGRPAEAKGRLARRAQNPAAGWPVRGGIEQRVEHCGAQRRPKAVPNHVREPLARGLRWPRFRQPQSRGEPTRKGDLPEW